MDETSSLLTKASLLARLKFMIDNHTNSRNAWHRYGKKWIFFYLVRNLLYEKTYIPVCAVKHRFIR